MLSSDCIVFEGTHPTTGGGYYLSVALQKNIPVLFLTQEEYKGLYLASYNRLLRITKYSPTNIKKLKKVIKSFVKSVNNHGLKKRFNLMINDSMDTYLNEAARTNGISKADVMRNLVYEKMQKSKV